MKAISRHRCSLMHINGISSHWMASYWVYRTVARLFSLIRVCLYYFHIELCDNLDNKINRDNKIHYRVKIMDFIIEIIVNSQILLCTIQNIQVCQYTEQFQDSKNSETLYIILSLFIEILIVIKIILLCIIEIQVFLLSHSPIFIPNT